MLDKVVKAICQKEGLHVGEIQPLSGGQVNAVFLVNGEYVVRIGSREDAYARLKRETDLVNSLAGQMPLPRILAFGQQDGLTYQVQQRVRGQKLYLVWNSLSPVTKEAIIAELASALKTLHSREFSHFGSGREEGSPDSSWQAFLSGKLMRTIDEIQALKIKIVPGFLDVVMEYFETHRHVLDAGAPVQLHGDLTLVNVLVDQGKVSALLDFEYALQAPRDYELWPLEAFCLYPNDWAEEDHEVFCAADFTDIFPLLQRFAPELFDVPHLRERMNCYHLEAALGSYLAWRKDNLSRIPPDQMAAKEFYMARITNFIFRHGITLF